MRYHYEKTTLYKPSCGSLYICDHPVYNRCTLYKINGKGLAVIQQRYDEKSKHTWWSEIDEWLTGELYLHPNFIKIFNERADVNVNGIYPTITIRQFMWALRMKPIPKKRWETCFDHRNI